MVGRRNELMGGAKERREQTRICKAIVTFSISAVH